MNKKIYNVELHLFVLSLSDLYGKFVVVAACGLIEFMSFSKFHMDFWLIDARIKNIPMYLHFLARNLQFFSKSGGSLHHYRLLCRNSWQSNLNQC